MDELLEITKENNRLLKKILSIMQEISSEEHIQREDMKALAINLVADLLVEYKGNQLKTIIQNIKL
nr:MAG TPA: hypothetical protein [Bacteriophage sp.]